MKQFVIDWSDLQPVVYGSSNNDNHFTESRKIRVSMHQVISATNFPKGLLIAGISKIRIISTVLIFVMFLVGCATTQTVTTFNPRSINEVRFRDRAQSKSDKELRVSVAVPTKGETEALFQADLIKKEIQPIWVKIENHSEHTYYLISTAADPNYFSPLEAAYAVRSGLSKAHRNEMEH